MACFNRRNNQMELAAVLEVSPAYLSLIATNRQPMSEPIAFKMEKLFGLSAEWILFEKGPRRIDSGLDHIQ